MQVSKRQRREPDDGVCPEHAGYVLSGLCAAYGLKESGQLSAELKRMETLHRLPGDEKDECDLCLATVDTSYYTAVRACGLQVSAVTCG
jgi:hypothetical protein